MPALASYDELLMIFHNETAAIQFCFQKGIFTEESICNSCGTNMTLRLDRGKLRCRKKDCRKEISYKKGTFFDSSKLQIHEILRMGYLWLLKAGHTFTEHFTKHSPNTITHYHRHFRCLVSTMLELEDDIIGGPGIIVEVDETKLGKRKYNRGHRVDGVWVLVGVERTEERKVFMVEIIDKTAETLLQFIRRHVRPGTIVYTDCFASYARIESELGLIHGTVNHSEFFIDPVTGIHTNTVEGTNNALKILIKPRNRVVNIGDHLDEFIWRRKNERGLWDAFVDALKEVEYAFE